MNAPPPGRRRLNEPDILEAATALIGTEGLASLTMRRLGAALDVEAMALYRYFPSRHALLDALVDYQVEQIAAHPDNQWQDDDDWRDYLDRIAHAIRQMALTHPRLFPLVASHPTAAPWIRPPIRSLDWVDAFLRGLQDHHFPPPAAVMVYKQFTTFLLGHLLLEIAALGLEYPDELTAPDAPSDPDRARAARKRGEHAGRAEQAMAAGDGPGRDRILDADPGPRTISEEPSVQAGAGTPAGAAVDAVASEVDVPLIDAVVSTAGVDLSGHPYVQASAGLLADDTAARDFEHALDRLINDVATLRRP